MTDDFPFPLSLRGLKGRGNLREPVLRTNRHVTATNFPKISGLALRFCPALCLCKTKCLPSHCGRLTPPQAALPCGPRHPFGAPRNDNVRTAVQPTNLVIARPERPWQSQGTDHMNQLTFCGSQLPQDCHVTPSGPLAMTTEELRCDPPAFLLEVRFCRAKKSVGGSGRCNYPLFILKNPSSALVRGRGVFHGTMISTALLWLAMCTRSRAPPNSPSRVHFTGQGNSNSTWPVWKV